MKDEPYYEYLDSNYCYPGTDVLHNKFDIRDSDALASVELRFELIPNQSRTNTEPINIWVSFRKDGDLIWTI